MMVLEWRLRHRNGTDCSHHREPFEYHAYNYGHYVGTMQDRVHPAQLIQFEIGQELCFGVDFETGFEYWVKRVE